MFNKLVLGLLALSLAGCASIASTMTGDMIDDLSAAILNQSDPVTVRDGAPSYLLLLDGLIEGDPMNSRLLLSGARLYSAYAGAFVVEDEARAQLMWGRALDYARRASCVELADLCAASDAKLDEFQQALASVRVGNIDLLYVLASSWAGWVQSNSGDWNAVADLPRVTALFERVVELDETWDQGGAHAYLGVIKSLIPAALGGKPEIAREHFERGIELSQGRNLMYKVLLARHYARAVFDKDLHDSLLTEVGTGVAEFPGYTLINTLARRQAEILLAESDEFF